MSAQGHRSSQPGEACVVGAGRAGVATFPNPKAQPLAQDASGSFCAFSGRLTNRAEILSMLARGEHPLPKNASDARIALSLYHLRGNEGFASLRGSFGLALWKSGTRSMTLVRSPDGTVPLYYTFLKGRLVFGTEAKVCLADPEVECRLSERSLFHFLTFSSTPPPHTLFENIFKVEAGTWLRMSPDGEYQSGRYWGLAERLAEAKQATNEELSQKVLRGTRNQLRQAGNAGERVAVHLDGGLTASATAIALKKYCPANVHTFSVFLEPLQPEVAQRAQKLEADLKRIGIPHQNIVLNQVRYQGLLPRLGALQDEPINRPADVLFHVAAEAAKKAGIDRMVNPLGANAVFLRLLRWADIAKKAKSHERRSTMWLREASVGLARLAKKPMKADLEAMERSLEGLPFYWAYREMFTRDEKLSLLTPRLRHSMNEQNSWSEVSSYWYRFEKSCPKAPIDEWMPFLEVALGVPEGLAMRHDQVCSAAQMEQFFPYLNADLVVDALALHSVTRDMEPLPRTTFTKVLKHLVSEVPIDLGTFHQTSKPLSQSFLDGSAADLENHFEEFFRQSELLDRGMVREMMEASSADRRWALYNFVGWWKGWFAV